MSKRRVVDLRESQPLLDIVSYGRGTGRLTREQLDQASRTARRVPEVVVRVSGGARTLRGVASHIDYIGREGQGEIETDMGETLRGRDVANQLLQEWDLDLEKHRRYPAHAISAGRRFTPKLVHNVIFSMPRGTPPGKVLEAVRRFAMVKFGLEHRYAMALHKDQGAPHVHLVVKAVSEMGVRLNIRKATLREWRREFAHQLRSVGIEANATERAVRGQSRSSKTTGIFRAAQRGASTHYRRQAELVARELAGGGVQSGNDKKTLERTRKEVNEGWLGFARRAAADGHDDIAVEARRFVRDMAPALTDKEWMAAELHRQRDRILHRPRAQ